jgi:hypothetical protein
MTRFRQYWRRAIRSGHAYAEVAMRRYRSSGKPWLRQTISILLYGFVFPIGILLTLLMPLALLLIAETLFFLLYLRLAISIVRYCRGRNRPWSLAVAYALVEIPCKLAAALGVLRFLIGRLSRRRSALIEYKADHATATEVTGKE